MFASRPDPANASRLRGRLVASTAPTAGNVLTWNNANSQWEPAAVAASPTTTRGDLIVRGVSADQRIAVGGSGKFFRSNGTDPSWQSILADDVSDASAVGRASLTAADEAAGRTAIGAAAASHTHGASDIASGTLAVARGGTGSGTASAARTALGLKDGPWLIPLFTYAMADAAYKVHGYAGFTPADYAIADRTTELTLDAIGSVTSVAQTGRLEVLDEAATVVAYIEWTETTRTRKTATITLPESAVIWRARVVCSGVVDPLTDAALIGGAHVRVTWS